MDRILDYIYLIYFITHIPITALFDSQIILPSWLYSDRLYDTVENYAHSLGDDLMVDKPAWFKAFVFCEVFLHLPFFFVAIYTYWKGVSRNKWIRIPLIMYTTNVITSMFCIYAHMFSSTGTSHIVMCIYLPYLIIPVIMLLDALFHSIYTDDISLLGNPRAMKKGV